MNKPPKHLEAAIELLAFRDAEGIHHNEKHWREVARWLLGECKRMDRLLAQYEYVPPDVPQRFPYGQDPNLP